MRLNFVVKNQLLILPGKKSCVPFGATALKVLSELLEHDDQEVGIMHYIIAIYCLQYFANCDYIIALFSVDMFLCQWHPL